MDGTLFEGRFIHSLAAKFGVLDKIKSLQGANLNGYQRTQEITKIFKGMPASELTKTAQTMKLVENVQSTITEIKQRGHVVGIISDSYLPVVRYLAGKFGLDFAIANNVELDANGKMTGVVQMPLGWQEIGCYCKISVCKRFHLEDAAKRFGIPIEDTVAVGDTVADSCMVKRAGIGITIMPKDKQIESASDVIIPEPDISRVLPYVFCET